MILKVAESMALKRAFTVSGLVSREEMDVIQEQKEDNTNNTSGYTDIKPDKDESKRQVKLSKREREIKEIVGNSRSLKKDMFSFLKFVKDDLEMPDDEKLRLDDLTNQQYKELKSLLVGMKERDQEITA